MNAEHDVRTAGAEAAAAVPADPETRLARNREILRHRLAQAQADQRSGVSGTLKELASASLPIARQTVRQHPYASLAAAALAGVLLARWKPLPRLGGSLLIGWLTRQALAPVSPGPRRRAQLADGRGAGQTKIASALTRQDPDI